MKVKVGVFTDMGKRGKPRIRCYTTWYDRQWEGCCEHIVEVKDRSDAKEAAEIEHRLNCLRPKNWPGGRG